MTRADAMLKLLALGELPLCELHAICGWPCDDVHGVLTDLVEAGRVTWRNGNGARHYGLPEPRGGRYFQPPSRYSPAASRAGNSTLDFSLVAGSGDWLNQRQGG